MVGNDFLEKVRDFGNAGKRLQDFVAMETAVLAELNEAHVLALRLYTSSSCVIDDFFWMICSLCPTLLIRQMQVQRHKWGPPESSINP